MMGSTVLPARSLWLSLARSSPHATFFHTPYWHELARAAGPSYRDGTTLVELADGTQAIVPITVVGSRVRGVFRRAVSTFGWCYGGPIAEAALSAVQQLAVQRQLLSLRTGSLALVGNVLAPQTHWLPSFQLRRLSTRVLDLDGDFARLLKDFSKGHRAAYTKGLRLGLRLRRASSAGDVALYLSMYARSLERWGERATSRYPQAFFTAVLQMSLRLPEHVAMWLVVRDQEVMAGAVTFYWNGHVVYWHGVMDERFQAESPSNTLVGEMIRDACERGFRMFDFNPSGGHEAVEAFKRRFGTREVLFERGDYRSPVLTLLDRLRGAA